MITGATATFTVAPSSALAATYAWQVSTDGGNTWSNVSGSAYAGTTTATLTINNPTTTMSGYQYHAVITNSAGTTTAAPMALAVAFSSGYLAWLQSNFTTAQLGQPSLVGTLSTPANDGIPNIIKYAFELNPFLDGHTFTDELPQNYIASGQVVLTFAIPPPDLSYTVQASTDLVNWSTTGVTITNNGFFADASYSLSGTTPAFLRLVVAPAP